jgi:hypothetical protein
VDQQRIWVVGHRDNRTWDRGPGDSGIGGSGIGGSGTICSKAVTKRSK